MDQQVSDTNTAAAATVKLRLFEDDSYSFFILDIEGKVRYWSGALARLTGTCPNESCGKQVGEVFDRFTATSIRERFDELFRCGCAFVLSPFVHKQLIPATLPNGESRFCRIEVTRGTFGDESLAVCMVKDISNDLRMHRHQQDKLNRLNSELEQRIGLERQIALERLNLEKTIEERTRELRSSLRQQELTNMRLEQANKHKSRFLSSMSHELRTPLNAVLGFNDLLRGQFFGELNEKQLNYVDQIDSSSKHLLALISDLLDIAKIDAGTMDLVLEDIPVEEFIYAAQTMMNPQFKEKNLSVNTYVDPEITTIQADRRKWKQIMLNLLSNAVKYTPRDGRLDVNVTIRDAESILVEVHDTGIGIKQDDINKVFTDFYQTERVRDQQLGGTGIGLALTKRMVELHKGEIGAESEPGKGSMFWFWLPISHNAEVITVEKETVQEETEIASSKRRILVVEDDPTNLEMVLDMLSIQGHEAHGACNGREALQLAESFKPDLVFMDIRMPVMDGFEATRELRKIEKFKKLPIIALTANTSAHAEKDCLDAGCSAYVSKPIRSAKLFGVLDEFLPGKGDE